MIFNNRDYEHSLTATLLGIFPINIERFISGKKISFKKSFYEKFANYFVATIKSNTVVGPISTSTKVGALISRKHWKKVNGYIKVSIKEGVKFLVGGGKSTNFPDKLPKGNFVLPAVFRNAITIIYTHYSRKYLLGGKR